MESKGNFLTEEIISLHILPKLPAKSLLRFKCVSKQWFSFISTRMFKDLHFNHVKSHKYQNSVKLLFFSATKKSFCTLECEAPERGFTTNRSLPFPFNADFERINILSSSHGLLCLGLRKGHSWHYSYIIFWNPCTCEYKTVSKGNSHEDCYQTDGIAWDLYYSSCDDDFKLLCVTLSCKTYIYSLKSDSWKGICFLMDVPHESQAWILRTSLNEKLYFLKEAIGDKGIAPYSIIRFDTKTEEFTEIAIPSFANRGIEILKLGIEILKFTVIRGSINLCVAYTDLKVNADELKREIELWRMVGDGQWTKVVTYWWKPYLTSFPNLLHVMNNGNWLMHFEENGKGYIYKTDMEKNMNVGISCSYNTITACIRLGEEYVETFVSPNRYIE